METETLLRCVPVDLVPTDDGVILSRGSMQFHVAGEDARDCVAAMVAAMSDEGMSRLDLIEGFPEAYREPVGRLLDQLIARRVIVPADSPLLPADGQESPLDVFYWNFGQSAAAAQQSLNARTLVIVGTNFLSRRFATSLVENGLTNLLVVDDPELRNARFYDDNEQLIGWPEWLGEPRPAEGWMTELEPGNTAGVVVLSDVGNRMAIRRWNATCVEHGLMLMPVVLDRMRGEIGPIVIPKETACYECLRARENANLTDPVKERLAEQAAVVGQIRNTFHGAMAGAVAEFAALEIAKLLSGAMLPKMGAFTTLALLEPSLQTRYVLKVPRCRVCSPMLWRPAPNLENRAFWNRVMDKAKRV